MFALFSFNAVEMLAMHWGNRTDPISLSYSFYNMWRLAVPVVYNILDIMDVSDSSFKLVMGEMQEVPVAG